jgi:hypothetical protein
MAARAILALIALVLASCNSGTTSVTSWENENRDVDCAASYLVLNTFGDFKCSQYGATASNDTPGAGIFRTFNLLGTTADGTTVNVQGMKSLTDRGYFNGIFDNEQSKIQNFNNLTIAAHDWTGIRALRSAHVASFVSARNQNCFGFIAPGSPSRWAGWSSYRRGFFCTPAGRPQFTDEQITSLIDKIELRDSIPRPIPPVATMPPPATTPSAPQMAAQPLAQTGPVSFAAPAVGTRFQSSNGYFQVTSVEGMHVTTVNAANRTANWEAGFLYLSNRADRWKIESIWPLEPGKSTTYEEHAANSDTWRHTVTVLRRETIRIPAGSFDTMVVEERIESLTAAQGNLDVTKTYWYAPTAKWPVKRNMVQRAGPPFSSEDYIVSAIVAP